MAWDPPGDHSNQVSGVAGVDLVVGDLEGACGLYERALGLRQAPPMDPGHACASLRYRFGGFVLSVDRPAGPGPVSVELDRRDPEPFRLVLASGDIDATAAALSRNDIRYDESACGIDIHPVDSSGRA